MSKIIAIGGGEIGRPGYPVETVKIDKEIIALSGKKKPRLLFIPTASSDAPEYVQAVKKYFGRRLGAKIDVLYLIKDKLGKKDIENKILSSDIIYVGGGNTLMMLKVWKMRGVEKILKKAWQKGIVISGLSAGAVCWFNFFSSDSKKIINKTNNLIKLRGLNWINASFCPHYDAEAERKGHLKKMMKSTSGIAIAADNCSAIEIINAKYRIITSKPKAKVYKIYWKGGKYYKEIIPIKKEFSRLNSLLIK